MNKKLKFSWGHIIAFVALIFISYIGFMGCCYLGWSLFKAIVVLLLIVVALCVVTLLPQMLKGANNHLKVSIWFERILLLISPFVFCFCIIIPGMPFAHFWTVCSKNDDIVKQFNESINASKQMFTVYESYSSGRMARYDSVLLYTIPNNLQFQTRKHALELLLKSDNYTNLSNHAYSWIKKSDNIKTVWNVFFVGNINTIDKTVVQWHNQLVKYSGKKFSDEPVNTVSFDDNGKLLKNTRDGLAKTNKYMKECHFSIMALLFGILSYAGLLVPWLIQSRDGKSYCTLMSNNKFRNDKGKAKKNNQSNGGGVVTEDDVSYFIYNQDDDIVIVTSIE